jgi:hypothetical protein
MSDADTQITENGQNICRDILSQTKMRFSRQQVIGALILFAAIVIFTLARFYLVSR